MTQEGRAGLDRLRPVCFRIRWALEDGGMESEVGQIHDPDNGRSVALDCDYVFGKCDTLVSDV